MHHPYGNTVLSNPDATSNRFTQNQRLLERVSKPYAKLNQYASDSPSFIYNPAYSVHLQQGPVANQTYNKQGIFNNGKASKSLQVIDNSKQNRQCQNAIRNCHHVHKGNRRNIDKTTWESAVEAAEEAKAAAADMLAAAEGKSPEALEAAVEKLNNAEKRLNEVLDKLENTGCNSKHKHVRKKISCSAKLSSIRSDENAAAAANYLAHHNIKATSTSITANAGVSVSQNQADSISSQSITDLDSDLVFGFFLPLEYGGGLVQKNYTTGDITTHDFINDLQIHGEENVLNYLREMAARNGVPYPSGLSFPAEVWVQQQYDMRKAAWDEAVEAARRAEAAAAEALAATQKRAVEALASAQEKLSSAFDIAKDASAEVKNAAVKETFVAGAEVASMIGDKFEWSSHLLKLSLKNEPLEGEPTENDRLMYDEDTEFSLDLADSPAFRQIFQDFRENVLNGLSEDVSEYIDEERSVRLTTANSSIDWYLALHKIDYQLSATKEDGSWAIRCKVTDKYNFEYWNWPSISDVPETLKTAINNYGAYAFDNGLLKSYDITIYLKDRPAL